MVLRRLLLILFVLSELTVNSQKPDSILFSQFSPFFTDFKNRPGNIQAFSGIAGSITNPQFYQLKNRGQEIIKIGQSLYLYFMGGGCLYRLQDKTDSLLYFKRIDNTDNFNYNLESYILTFEGDIYNIGGYGFWKSNGTLRKFNRNDKEWDAEPLNKEIFLPFSASKSWYNPIEQKLYIPYQQIINSGIKQSDVQENIIKEVYSLDLNTKNWEKLGETNPSFFELIHNQTWIIPVNTGQLSVSGSDHVFWIDYSSNQIKSVSNSALAQSLLRLNNSYLKYFYNNTIYFLNTENWHYDSLYINPDQFIKAGITVWNNQYVNYITAVLCILIILIAAMVLHNKYRQKTKNNQITPEAGTLFSESERSLLQFLITESKQNKTATISDINYLLGLKDKNIGLQKKVRSDVINLINKKYSQTSRSADLLIQNVRSRSDKRYFEYFINKELLEEIKNLIES